MISIAQKLGNIGSEFGRTMHWKTKQEAAPMNASLERLLSLLDAFIKEDLTLPQRRELLRLRELILDHILDTGLYSNSLSTLNTYFIQFGLLARQHHS